MTRPVPEALLAALAEAQAVTVLTGSGISAPSGVPTFRGPGGLWKGQAPEELATPFAFHRDPEAVWEFYDWRRTLLADCRPNPGHQALLKLEDRYPFFALLTQNVDGLHQAAGSRKVIELHGNIWRVRCLSGCGEHEDRRVPLPRPLPPHCSCKSLLRPAVVWFGEPLPREAFEEAETAAADAEVFFVVGTSGAIEPAASLARIAKRNGARVVEINPEGSLLSSIAHDIFRESAAEALPRIITAMEETR